MQTPQWPRVPEDLESVFTMDGHIPVVISLRNNGVSHPVHNTENIYKETFDKLRKGTMEYYGNTLDFLLQALNDFPIQGRRVMVAGLAGCNCDAIAIEQGAANVLVIDYNPPQCDHPLVQSKHVNEFYASNEKLDAVFSISSYEHDGLGRYGDPLDPNGDIKAMQMLLPRMEENGLLYLAVPIGQDCLVWNAHRIYGTLRLPFLLGEWTFLGSYGLNHEQFNAPLGDYIQPIMVLSADKKAINYPSHIDEMSRMAICDIAQSGYFDQQYYINTQPDSLCARMDAISHYVLHGQKAGYRVSRDAHIQRLVDNILKSYGVNHNTTVI